MTSSDNDYNSYIVFYRSSFGNQQCLQSNWTVFHLLLNLPVYTEHSLPVMPSKYVNGDLRLIAEIILIIKYLLLLLH